VHAIDDIPSAEIKIQKGSLTGGIYFYEISNGSDDILRGRLVIE